MRLMLSIVAILSASCDAFGRVNCELTAIELSGWSSEAQAFWSTEIERVVSDRVRVFVASGEFRPLVYALNGNTAALSSATMTRVNRVTDTTDSDKAKVGTIAGTEIPVYEIQSARERRVSDVVEVRDAAYRLPVRAPFDLPRGTRETVIASADCLLTDEDVPTPVASLGPRRVVRFSKRPRSVYRVKALKTAGVNDGDIRRIFPLDNSNR